MAIIITMKQEISNITRVELKSLADFEEFRHSKACPSRLDRDNNEQMTIYFSDSLAHFTIIPIWRSVVGDYRCLVISSQGTGGIWITSLGFLEALDSVQRVMTE